MARKNNTTNTTTTASARARKNAPAYRHEGNRLEINLEKGQLNLYLTREVLDSFLASKDWERLSRVALRQMPGRMYVRQQLWDAEKRGFVPRKKDDFVADVCEVARMFMSVDERAAKQLDKDFKKLVKQLVRDGKLVEAK